MLAALAAADELPRGSLEAAERYMALAERGSVPVPDGRSGQAHVLLGLVRLQLARQRGNLSAVAEQARRLQALAEAPEAAQPGLGDELRALALVSLGITEFWAARFEEAQRHLEQGVALARRVGRPYLEFSGLAYQATVYIGWSPYARAAECSRQAIELAKRHGWTDEPTATYAYMVLAAWLVWQGRPEEAEPGRSAPSTPHEPKPSPRRRCRSATSAGSSSWRAARLSGAGRGLARCVPLAGEEVFGLVGGEPALGVEFC